MYTLSFWQFVKTDKRSRDDMSVILMTTWMGTIGAILFSISQEYTVIMVSFFTAVVFYAVLGFYTVRLLLHWIHYRRLAKKEH